MKKLLTICLLALVLAITACIPGTIQTAEPMWDGPGYDNTSASEEERPTGHGGEVVTEPGQTAPVTSANEPTTPYESPNGLDTDSDAYCIVDEEGQIVFSLNPYSAYAPASITKVLTALVAYENADPDDLCTVSPIISLLVKSTIL